MLMEKQQTPAWINRAAEEITRYVHRTPPTFECLNLQESGTKFKINSIISAHAPQPKAFDWARWVGDTWYAKTPFGDYCAHRRWWSFNGYSREADSLEAAKAAAYADYCKRIAACYGEAPK